MVEAIDLNHYLNLVFMWIKDCCVGFNRYTYRMGHRLLSGSYIWSKSYSFKSSPFPGEESLQRVIIFGDMGKVPSIKFFNYIDYNQNESEIYNS